MAVFELNPHSLDSGRIAAERDAEAKRAEDELADLAEQEFRAMTRALALGDVAGHDDMARRYRTTRRALLALKRGRRLAARGPSRDPQGVLPF